MRRCAALHVLASMIAVRLCTHKIVTPCFSTAETLKQILRPLRLKRMLSRPCARSLQHHLHTAQRCVGQQQSRHVHATRVCWLAQEQARRRSRQAKEGEHLPDYEPNTFRPVRPSALTPAKERAQLKSAQIAAQKAAEVCAARLTSVSDHAADPR